MSESQENVRSLENQAEEKVQEWRRSKTGTDALQQELMTLVCERTFHSAKLARLYTEVLLHRGGSDECRVAFDGYVSLQRLCLFKAKSGARSFPDSVEDGTVSIFTLMLNKLEQRGTSENPRLLALESQLREILDQYPEAESAEVASRVAPIFARIAVYRLVVAKDDVRFNNAVVAAGSWFAKVDDSVADAETDYARALFLALTKEPTVACHAVRAALRKSPEHVRSILLVVQLLSAEQEQKAALQIASAFLARMPKVKSPLDKSAVIMLKKTQIALLEILQGPEASLNELTDFIGFVNELFAVDGPVGNNDDTKAPSHTDNSKPGHRIFSFKKKNAHNGSIASHVTSPSGTSTQRGLAEADSRVIAFSWFWIAQQYAKVGLESEAREALSEGKTYLPSDQDFGGLAQIQALIGQIEQSKNPQRALKHYIQALEFSPLHVSATIGAASVLVSDELNTLPLDLDNGTDSENELSLTLSGIFETICQRTPGRFVPEAWYMRGRLYEKLGVAEEARKMYWRAIELEERRGVTAYVTAADTQLC